MPEAVMFALKNLVRRKVRTLLTVLGVSFAVATVVALLSTARGFTSQFNDFFVTGDAHLVVTRKNVADPFLSYVPDELIERLSQVPGVAAAHPFLWTIHQLPANPFFFFFGTSEGSPILAEMRVTEGRGLFDPGVPERRICLGRDAATILDKTIGSSIELGGEDYEVVGIFEAGTPLLAAGGLLPFGDAQEVSGLDGKMSSALIQLERFSPEDIRTAEAMIEEAFPQLQATEPASFTSDFEEFELTEKAMSVFSVMAVVIGGIGVMNTMLMSVFERTREIGVLQAIGWSKGMVLRQILTEGVVICCLGGVLGAGLGALAVEGIGSIDELAWVAGDYGLGVFVEAFAVTIAMGLFGAAYPALRAVRITPVEALRYE
ncbi:MAG: ABC transporter permease [Planctomycetota bacterium]|nr:ABC transporter permease [Planctomycetota bacterium]